MRKTRQNKSEKISLSLLFRQTRRTVLFLFLFLSVLILLYVIGNYQLFLDSTQRLILNTASVTATLLTLLGTSGFIESIFCIIQKKQKRLYYILHSILNGLAAVFALLCLVVFRTTVILSTGIN